MIHFTELTFPILKSVSKILQGEHLNKYEFVHCLKELKPLLEVRREDGTWLNPSDVSAGCTSDVRKGEARKG